MKTEFELYVYQDEKFETVDGSIQIVGKAPNDTPYVVIDIKTYPNLFIRDKDIELFAVNILKSMKSKKLKS